MSCQLQPVDTQDVQDTVEQLAGVTSGSADVRLRWREVPLDDCPEIAINFSESHDPEFYLKDLIHLGRSPHQDTFKRDLYSSM